MTSPVESDSPNEVIIHVFVVGFHHKKGCVVEFSYPSLADRDNLIPGDLPELWKHLPTLALPDGAHNYEEDTIYFHLPSLDDPTQTIYGISCYRQMSAQQLLRRSSDITRETVQKSVCVLSRLPLFGLIQAKLELITHAYFDERDFSKVSLLEETYRNLNSSLPTELIDGQQAFLGLSVRDFVLRFKHKALLLFKLLLLEKKVLFYKAPVKDLCSAVLTLCSLIPGMIETGLSEAASSVPSGHSPDLLNDVCDSKIPFSDNNNKSGQDSAGTPSNVDIFNSDQPHFECNLNNNLVSPVKTTAKDMDIISGEKLNDASAVGDQNSLQSNEFDAKFNQSSSDTENDSWTKVIQPAGDLGSNASSVNITTDVEMKVENAMPNKDRRSVHEIGSVQNACEHTNIPGGEFSTDSRCLSETDVNRFMGYITLNDDHSSNSLPMTVEAKSLSLDKANVSAMKPCCEAFDGSMSYQAPSVIDIESSKCGLPLPIFTKGMMCQPYLSLPFLDVLNDVNVRGFIVGATNILFKQKKHLFDVIVEVEEGKIEILDPELRRILNLTTEDLRFADHLLRHVMEDKKDVFLDGTGWEGGDEWLRSQFKLYLLSVMRTSLMNGCASKEADAFNPSFVNSWKLTHNHRMWNRENHLDVLKFSPGHPFQGQLSMADMKLKFSHSMQSSEKGRRINSAVANTGKAVLQTGKAVGKVVLSVVRNRLSHPGGRLLALKRSGKIKVTSRPKTKLPNSLSEM